MNLRSRNRLFERLNDPAYRHQFVASRLSHIVAAQIRAMRQKTELSQQDFARALGTSQNAVSRMENPKYGKLNVSTLKKIAQFFDVALVIRFVPFSELVDWTIGMSSESVIVPTFARHAHRHADTTNRARRRSLRS